MFIVFTFAPCQSLASFHIWLEQVCDLAGSTTDALLTSFGMRATTRAYTCAFRTNAFYSLLQAAVLGLGLAVLLPLAQLLLLVSSFVLQLNVDGVQINHGLVRGRTVADGEYPVAFV